MWWAACILRSASINEDQAASSSWGVVGTCAVKASRKNQAHLSAHVTVLHARFLIVQILHRVGMSQGESPRKILASIPITSLSLAFADEHTNSSHRILRAPSCAGCPLPYQLLRASGPPKCGEHLRLIQCFPSLTVALLIQIS